MTLDGKQSWEAWAHHLASQAQNIAESGYKRVRDGVQATTQLTERVGNAAAGTLRSAAAAAEAATRGAVMSVATTANDAIGGLVTGVVDQAYEAVPGLVERAAGPDALEGVPFREVGQNNVLSVGEKARVVRDLAPLIVGALELSQEEMHHALKGDEGAALVQRFREGLQGQRDQAQLYLTRAAAATAGIGGGVLGVAASSLLPIGPMAAGVVGLISGASAFLGVNNERSQAYVDGVVWDRVIGSREEIDREKEIYRKKYYNAIHDVLEQAKANLEAEDFEFCDLAAQLICQNIPKDILTTQVPEALIDGIAETLTSIFNWSLRNPLNRSDIDKREEAHRQEKEEMKQLIHAYLQGTGDPRELPALLRQAIGDVAILAMAGDRSKGIKGFYDRLLTPEVWSRMANAGLCASYQHLNWVSEARDEVLKSGMKEGSEAFSHALIGAYLKHRVKDEKNGLASKVLGAGPDPEAQKEVKINHYEKMLVPLVQTLLQVIAGEIPPGGIALGRRSPLLFIAQEILINKKITLTVPDGKQDRMVEIELFDFAKELAQKNENRGGHADCQDDLVDEGFNLLGRVLAEQIQEMFGLLQSQDMLKLGLANLLSTDQGESSPPDDLAEMQERDENQIPKDSLGIKIEKDQFDYIIQQSVYNLRRNGLGKVLHFFLRGPKFTDLVKNSARSIIEKNINLNTKEKVWRKFASNKNGLRLIIEESINLNTKEKVWRKIVSNLGGTFEGMIGPDLEVPDERQMQDKLKAYTERRLDLYLKKREIGPLHGGLKKRMLDLIDAVYRRGGIEGDQDIAELRDLDEEDQAVCLRIVRDLKKKQEHWTFNRKLKERVPFFKKIAESETEKEQIFAQAKSEIVEGRGAEESREASLTEEESVRVQKAVTRLTEERIVELMKEQYDLERHEMTFHTQIVEEVRAEIRDKFFNHNKISGERVQRLLTIEKNEFLIDSTLQEPECQEKIKQSMHAYLKSRGNEGTARERLKRANAFSLEHTYHRALRQRADFAAEFVVESVVDKMASPFKFVAEKVGKWSHAVSGSFNSLTNRSWSIVRVPLQGLGWLVGKVNSAVVGLFRKIGETARWVANRVLFLRLGAWLKDKIARRIEKEINAVLEEKLSEGVHEYWIHDMLEKALEEFWKTAQEAPSLEEAAE